MPAWLPEPIDAAYDRSISEAERLLPGRTGEQASGAIGGVADYVRNTPYVDFQLGLADSLYDRQFDDTPGGGVVELPAFNPDVDDETESIAGFDWWGLQQENPLIGSSGPVRNVYDTVFEYNQWLNGERDSADLPGPNLGDAVDEGTDAADDAADAVGGYENLAGLITGSVVFVAVLWLLRPVLEIFAAVVGE